MLAGHYSAAFLAKAATPRTPLWLLALAAQLVDVLWALFILSGVERMHLDPTLPSNPLVLDHMPYTHSLLGTVALAGLAGYAAHRWLHSTLAAVIVSGAVISHWVLDLLVHRPDLTLWGAPPMLGLGLWDLPVIAFAVEVGLLALSAVVVLRSGAIASARRAAFLVGLGVLVAVQLVVTVNPPPLDASGIAATGLVTYLLVVAGLRWAERKGS